MIDKVIIERILNQFRINPAGIRFSKEMNRICLKCGSDHVVSQSRKKHYYRYCMECGAEYYRHVCWNCHRSVDSRDPQNPSCIECNWLKCSCSACSPHDCATNPYHFKNRLIDNPDYLVPSKNRPDHCPECGGGGYDQDNGQCDTCRGSGDWTESDYYLEEVENHMEIKKSMFEAPPHDYGLNKITDSSGKF